tara:strand:- start:456 stop:767 length:312 start_codon:yes stop_codon:yes gene_type:complete
MKEKRIEQLKAEDLLNSYKCYLHEVARPFDSKSWVDINKTKNDAIKAVNLVLDEQRLLLDHMDIFALDERRKYWKEVRSCIGESEILTIENEKRKTDYEKKIN